jgi:hypothetical protein
VVLSGCDSARGQVGAGEGLIGLAWALQRGGARSVVGCGWEVDDQATRELMAHFARNLASMERAEALRQAQLAILRRGGKRAHPYYRAAPVLIGRTDALGPLQPPADRPLPILALALLASVPLIACLLLLRTWRHRSRR